MLLLIFAWVFLLFLFYLFGLFILQMTADKISGTAQKKLHIAHEYIIATWLGLVSISVVLLTISIFFKLSFSLFFIVTIILTSISLSSSIVRSSVVKLSRNFSSIHLMNLMMILVFAAFVSTAKAIVYDTGLYHIQFVKWLSEFGTVPGLALLHSRFGFTSSWFALAAPWNSAILEGRAIALTGGLALILTLIHFIISVQSIIRNGMSSRAVISDLFFICAIVICLPFLVQGGLLVSASPDIPATFLTIEVAWLMLVISNISSQRVNLSLIPLLLASGAVGIKLSTLPILLIAFVFYCFYGTRTVLSNFIRGVIIISVMLSPFLLVNLVSSGCPLFPSSLFCSNLSWSIGAEKSHVMSASIQNWARWLGPMPEDANAFNWLLRWLGLRKEATFLIFSSFFSAFAIWRIPNQDSVNGKPYLVAASLLGIAFMLVKAPDTRFGLGFLVILPALFIALVLQSRLRAGIFLLLITGLAFYTLSISAPAWHLLFVTATSVLYLGFLVVWCIQHRQPMALMVLMPTLLFFLAFFPHSQFLFQTNSELQRVFWPPKIKTTTVVSVQTDTFTYSQPTKDDRCFAAPLPCTPGVAHATIQLRQPNVGLKGGFER